MIAWYEIRALIERHPSYVARDIKEVGVPTFLLLLTSYIVVALLLEVLRRVLRAREAKGNARQRSPSGSLLRDLRLNLLNFAILGCATPFAAPIICILFGHGSKWPSTYQVFATWLLSTTIFDLWFYASHRAFHTYRVCFRLVHRWRHDKGVQRERTGFSGYAMHPFEMIVLAIGAVFATLCSRAAFFSPQDPLPIRFFWGMLVMAQAHIAYIYSSVDISFVTFLPSFLPISVTAPFVREHEQSGGTCNYGGITRCWDWLLHTSYSMPATKSE